MIASNRMLALCAALVVGVTPLYASIDKPEAVQVPPPPPGKTEVVFFREGGFSGSAISCAVKEGKDKISSLPPGRFFILVTNPGEHDYSSTSSSDNGVHLNLKEGEVRYVRCSIKVGFWAGKGSLDLAKEEEFSSKRWKSVDPTRIGPNVLTDAQIRGAKASDAAGTPAEEAKGAAQPDPTPAPAQPNR